MSLNWSTFFASLAGTTIPGLLVSLFLLWLNNRSSKSIESYKSQLSGDVAVLHRLIRQQEVKSNLWHQKRVDALVELYLAFASFLDFLRRLFYVAGSRLPMDPYHEIHKAINKNRIYLDDDLCTFINQLHGELLMFANWAHTVDRPPGITDDPVQHKLDHEIPMVLERLRVKINDYADPDYETHRESDA